MNAPVPSSRLLPLLALIATVGSPAAPHPPWEVRVSRDDLGQLILQWASLGEGYRYRVQFTASLTAETWLDVPPGDQWPVAATSWVIVMEAGARSGFYRVRAEAGFDPGLSPTGLTAEISGHGASLAWNAFPGAVGYVVYRALETDFPPEATTRIEVAAPRIAEAGLAFDIPYHYRVAALGDGGESRPSSTISLRLLPPPLDPGVASTVSAQAGFLFEGDAPIQTGVVPGAIVPRRMTLVRGKVLDREGRPLAETRVRVRRHPEWGETRTRLDGAFALAVSGGSRLALSFEREGFLSAQRVVLVAWQEQAELPPVVLREPDPVVSTIDLSAGADAQIARSSVSIDDDGPRQTTILFPGGTRAEMVLPDGSRQPLDTLNVRATEFTVGGSGPRAMPAQLPSGTGYTYCVDLGVDEAVAAHASWVEFDRSQFVYVDNFLGFPAGTVVPSGYYDPDGSLWVPSPNGRVIGILSTAGGIAALDVDGSGTPAGAAALEALGVTEEERARLAALYAGGKSLWRVPVSHFSTFDFNWGIGPDAEAEPPAIESWVIDGLHTVANWISASQQCTTAGSSLIDNQAQILRETLPVTGVDFGLSYSSARCPDFLAAFQTRFPITGDTLPPGLKRVEVEVRIGGASRFAIYPAEPGLSHTFTWNGKDAFGRTVQGRHRARIRLGYVYDAYYQEPQDLIAAFGYTGNGVPLSVSKARMEFTFYQEWETDLGTFDTRPAGLGGWTFEVHHHYDPMSRTLFLGDGTIRSAASVQTTIETIGGGGDRVWDSGPAIGAGIAPYGIAVDPAGNAVFASYRPYNRIQRITPDGAIETLAGGGTASPGDGRPAIEAGLVQPYGLTLGPDGSIYFSEERAHRVRRIDPNGILHTVAGTGVAGFAGDGGPATAAQLDRPQGIDLGPDGSLYIADSFNHRVRRVAPDGRIQTIAGTGREGFGGDWGLATAASTSYPNDVAAAPDGSVYFSSWHDVRVRRIALDGMVSTAVGGGRNDRIATWEGVVATSVAIGPISVEVSPSGSLLVTDRNSHSLYAIRADQTLQLISGVASYGYSGDGGPAYSAQLAWPWSVAVDPAGNLILSVGEHVRRIGKPLASFGFGEIAIASLDGSRVYRFDPQGRHLDTRHALTGGVLHSFDYDAAGRLIRVTDGDGNVTTVEHDAAGEPLAIVSPFGHRTTLTADAHGFLATISDPSGAFDGFTCGEGGLLRGHVDRLGHASEYAYDSVGRLQQARGADGTESGFTRQEEKAAFTVVRSDAEGTEWSFRVATLPDGSSQFLNRMNCCGIAHEALHAPDASSTLTRANGLVTRWTEGPDPQFGMQAPLAAQVTDTTPMGLERIRTVESSATTVLAADRARLDTLTVKTALNGRLSTATYTNTNRTIRLVSPEGRQQALVLDPQGRPVEWRVPGLDRISVSYDERGRLDGLRDGTREWTYAYDADTGFLSQVTDPLDHTTACTRDVCGRVTHLGLPDGSTWRTGWDAAGRPIEMIAPAQENPHRFEWSAAGLLIAHLTPLGQRTEWHYDKERRLTRKTCPAGEELIWAYGSRGLLERLSLPTGVHVFTYDTNSAQLIRSVSADGQGIDFRYDGDLLTRAGWGGGTEGTVDFAYDDDFRLVKLAYAGASFDLSYDNDGLLTGLGAAVISRDPVNGLLRSIAQGGLVTTYTFDAHGAVQTAAARHGETVLQAIECGYDTLGRVSWKDETVAGTTTRWDYAYDARGRLVSVARDGLEVERYGWDAAGNRTRVLNSLRSVRLDPEDFAHDADQKLLRAGSTEFAYDANGRLAKVRGGTSISACHYRADGALTSVDLPDGREIRYRYDAFLRPVARLVDGVVERRWLYGTGWLPLAEYDGDGTLRTRYEYLGGTLPSACVRGGATYRVLKLQATAPLLILDETGAVVKRVDYDAWGNVLADSNPAFEFAFGWVGGIADPDTGLIRLGVRDYDPATGRWTARDPLLFAGTRNLYAYAENDPVNNLDRIGMAVEVGIEGPGSARAVAGTMDGGIAGDAMVFPSAPFSDAAVPPPAGDDRLIASGPARPGTPRPADPWGGNDPGEAAGRRASRERYPSPGPTATPSSGCMVGPPDTGKPGKGSESLSKPFSELPILGRAGVR
ncbi:MAG: hypothetical protein H7A47_08600 [Verrucomicrobiales bacterium]|nr:hypothetical protein [Verrucomicrobiales bacterium]